MKPIALALLLLCAMPAGAQFSEDVVFHFGTNGAAAAAKAPDVFAVDWANPLFDPFQREWRRRGRPEPLEFPCVWIASQKRLVRVRGSVAAAIGKAQADVQAETPAMDRYVKAVGTNRFADLRRDARQGAGSASTNGTTAAQLRDLRKAIDDLIRLERLNTLRVEAQLERLDRGLQVERDDENQ